LSLSGNLFIDPVFNQNLQHFLFLGAKKGANLQLFCKLAPYGLASNFKSWRHKTPPKIDILGNKKGG
jgi:hypothetical protein